MMKLVVRKASCKVRFRKFLGGSVLKGTVYNRWETKNFPLRPVNG